MLRFLVVAALALGACKKDPPQSIAIAPALKPIEISVDGVLHATQCGAVTALWAGNPDALKDLPQPAPKSFAVESLSFKFADGTSKGFAPTGQVFFNDWRFDIFSPDCTYTVLLIDHYGPYHVVKTSDLRDYFAGRVKPVVIEAKGTTAMVHSDLTWKDKEHFDFVASCCGGAQVFTVSTKDGSIERVFEAANAPKGVRNVNGKWEAAP